MKKFVALFIMLRLSAAILFSQDAPASIYLPDIEIRTEDIKSIQTDLMPTESKLPKISFEPIPIPDFTEAIKIDLEKTLPERISSPEKQKPVDALILFGYGLNNSLMADFSIFVKTYNPKVSIHYLRESKETLWFDRTNVKNAYSKDDLDADLIFNYKMFELGTELGYFAESYDLQKKSAYDSLTKRILNIDVAPSLKFNFQNDLTLRVLNSLLFTSAQGEINDDQIKRSDINYLLNADLVYTQVFGSNHYFTADIGYDFSLADSVAAGGGTEFKDQKARRFFNTVKAGLGYSTTIKDAVQIKGTFDFKGLFKDRQFYWYILPAVRVGYSLVEFFHCYIEGGGKLIDKPERYWFENNKYSVVSPEAVPGTKWFAKTGVKGAYTGIVSGYMDFEFAYDQNGNEWELTDNDEYLYTVKKRDHMEINLGAGVEVSAKEFFTVKIDWLHYFYERVSFVPRDELKAAMIWGVPKIGLSFFIDFYGGFYRQDHDARYMGNIYLMNAGIDWNWRERIGVGVKFANILYFHTHQVKQGYDEPGFEFLGYVKIGF